MRYFNWVSRYHWLKCRLPENVYVAQNRWTQDACVTIGSNAWDAISPDKWNEVEKVLAECGEKILAVLREPDD